MRQPPNLGKDAPRLDYLMHLFTSGEVTTRLTLAPSLNFLPDRAVRIAVRSMTKRRRS